MSSGLLDRTRLTVSIGTFAATDGVPNNYTGQVATVGANGYTVDDIAAGSVMFDGQSLYEVVTTTVVTAGSLAELQVAYLSGTNNTPQVPTGDRGQITTLTENVELLLVTPDGSNYITPADLAKILTHNMILIDQYLAGIVAGTPQPDPIQTYETLNVTGTEITVPNLPENPSYVRVVRNYQELFTTEFSIPAGGGKVVPTSPSDNESWKIEWRP